MCPHSRGQVFSWTQQANSAVVLIGIANGLDLTERVLPMLKGRGLSPQVLHFMPYSKPQLVAIIRARIADVRHFPARFPPF